MRENPQPAALWQHRKPPFCAKSGLALSMLNNFSEEVLDRFGTTLLEALENQNWLNSMGL
jgi:hypothetical protein